MSRTQPHPPFPKQHQDAPGLESALKPRPRYRAPDYKAAGKLADKVALVTGGDSGIGRAVAVMYAREGANVAIAYLPEEQTDAEETRDAIAAHRRQCLLLPGDLRTPGECDRIVEATVAEFGRLDILVSNAAHQARKESLEELTDDELARTFETNVYAYFKLARAALRHMKRGASIIATSSETAILGSPMLPDYSSTKGAIDSLTKTLAKSLIDKGIRVNAVAPGPVETAMAKAVHTAEIRADYHDAIPLNRYGLEEELAEAIFFLCSERASYITGQVLAVDGGFDAAGIGLPTLRGERRNG